MPRKKNIASKHIYIHRFSLAGISFAFFITRRGVCLVLEFPPGLFFFLIAALELIKLHSIFFLVSSLLSRDYSGGNRNDVPGCGFFSDVLAKNFLLLFFSLLIAALEL